MKRMKVLFGQRRIMVLATLAILVLTAAALIASSASFTATTSNPDNTFTAGVMSLGNSKDVAGVHHAIFDTAVMDNEMKPGDTASGSVTITNGPDVSGKVLLSTSALTSLAGTNGGQLRDALDVVITNTTAEPDYVVYAGPIDTVPDDSWTKADNATWAAGEPNTFTFLVTFRDGGAPGSPTTGDNVYQGTDMSIQFDWEAISSN
jgi:hypothetical protein